MRLLIRSVVVLLAVAWAGSAIAGDIRQNLGEGNLALKGYDAVAYQTEGAPVPGTEAFTATHDGATYRFASAANRDTFAANPAQYMPAYGGYCAMGVVFGKKFDVDPAAFRVVDGTLYLNVNKDIQARWQQDIPGNITKAAGKWPEIADKAPADLK